MTKKYYEGSYIPPNNIFFKKEIEPKEYSNGRKIRRGIFVCPYDGTEFISTLQDIYTGHTTSCGCKNILNLVGQKFGKLTVLRRDYDKQDKNHNFYWECQCDCGNIISVGATYLKSGKSLSCQSCSQVIDIKGQKFGSLTPLQFMYQDTVEYTTRDNILLTFTKKPNIGGAQWICECDCGRYIVCTYNHLVNFHTTSCGCQAESFGERQIRLILNELQLNYISQFPITDNKYRLDFYIPSKSLAIEYDGEQHYRAINFFGGEERLKQTQDRDNKKNRYCLKNNIRLVRIPYTEKKNLTINFISDIIYNNNHRYDVKDYE